MPVNLEKLANVFIAEDNEGDVVLLKLLMAEQNFIFNLHQAKDGDEAYDFSQQK